MSENDSERLIIVDGYNLIHRTEQLKPGPERTLEQSRDKLLNLLAWAIGTGDARFIVVFDGAGGGGRDQRSARVEVRFSRPPETADDVIRRLVEERIDRGVRVTVVTADLEVARHARAMGADIALSDLFLSSALGPVREGEPEKPVSISKKELEDWAELFRRGKPAGDETEH
jgi:predicted RNA-binding protein with PIN domain